LGAYIELRCVPVKPLGKLWLKINWLAICGFAIPGEGIAMKFLEDACPKIRTKKAWADKEPKALSLLRMFDVNLRYF
jgi:hypothetical protein